MTDLSWFGEAVFWLGFIGAGAALLLQSMPWFLGLSVVMVAGAIVALAFD